MSYNSFVYVYSFQKLSQILKVLKVDKDKLTDLPLDIVTVVLINVCAIVYSLQDVDKILPVLEVDEKKLINPPKDKIQVTWIGHATLLVQFDGITILTDPAFSTYCGPSFSTPFGFGYKRYREAACKVKHIPGVDFVIVSNDHFDHLDEQSAEDIKQHFPKAKWFIGNRGGDLIPGMNENITEMNWWEEKNITNNEKSFKFVCTPAQHWCRRSAFDLNKVILE